MLIIVAVAASVIFSLTHGKAASIPLSNKATSLRILYQNNLNSTDDVNHVPVLLLDPVEQRNAQAACATIGEDLLDSNLIKSHLSDFEKSFAYLSYSGHRFDRYYIRNAVLWTHGARGKFSIMPHAFRESFSSYPVLCTGTQGGQTANSSNAVVIRSRANTYSGFRNQKAFNFLGIPFADTPDRFTYAKPYSGYRQTISAVDYKPQCAQATSGSEDCLYLNVFSSYLPRESSTASLRPVLFWIHGGGFTGGNGATDGSNLASREDIVFVSIQYRLSTLGFLAIPGTDITGNYGIADQILALEVRQTRHCRATANHIAVGTRKHC